MAEPESRALEDHEIELLISAVASWVERHPYPDFRAFAYADSDPFSPQELLISLQEGGAIARQFLRMTQFALEVESLEGLISGFEGLAFAR